MDPTERCSFKLLNQSIMAAKQVLASLQKNGIGVLENFLSPQVCDQAIKEIDSLILGFTPSPD